MSNYLNVFKLELQNKNYARNTIKVYVNKLKAYFDFLRKNNYGSYREGIMNFINSQNGEVSKRHAYYALKFFYKLVLKKECPYVLTKIKTRKRLPDYLSKDDIIKILSCITNKIHYCMIALMYAGGLRVSEITNLKISDIDLSNLIVIIKNSKGYKDRMTLLSDKLLPYLYHIMKGKKGSDFLFQTIYKKKYPVRTVQKIFENALIKSNVQKKASCHTLRHSFAIHLLHDGVDIRRIKNLLGHKSIKTTMIYLQAKDMTEIKIRSPL